MRTRTKVLLGCLAAVTVYGLGHGGDQQDGRTVYMSPASSQSDRDGSWAYEREVTTVERYRGAEAPPATSSPTTPPPTAPAAPEVVGKAPRTAVETTTDRQAPKPAGEPAPAPPALREPLPEVMDDDPRFDCRVDGNRTCGPGGPNAAGCYVGGELVTPWTDSMWGTWHNCGPITEDDQLKMDRLDGRVPQVCTPNDVGGVTCDWADVRA